MAGNKLVWKWSLSYFCIVLIPVIFGGLLYLLAMNTVRDKSEELHRLLAEEREHVLARSCEELNEYANQVFSSTGLAQVYGDVYTKEQRNYYAKEVQVMLKRVIAECSLIDKMVLYLPQSQSFLSESWQFEARESADFFKRKMGFSQEYFYWMLANDAFSRLHICETEGEKQEILYIRALSVGVEYEKQRAILLLYINQTRLKELIAVDGINFYLEDSEGNSYAILSEEEHISIEHLQKQRQQTGELTWIRDECVFYSTFEPYGVSLYNVQHDVRFVRENRYMRYLLVVYCMMCVIVGFALTYIRSRKNYQPIGGLVALLEKSGEKLDGADTWTELQTSVRNLSKKYRDGLAKQRESSKRMKESSLRQLLLAGRNLRYTEFYKQSNAYEQAAYRVVNVDTSETGEGYQEIVQSPEDVRMLHFIIDNVVSELLEGSCLCQGTTIDDELYFLLLYEAKEWETVRERLEQVVLFFKSSYAMELFFNISEAVFETENIPNGVQETQYLTQLRNEFGSEKRLLHFDSDGFSRAEAAYIRECKAKLSVLHLVNENQMEEAAALLRRLFPEKQEEGGKLRERRRETDNLIETVTDYIEENYSNPQLTAGYLAEQFELSISKLSREFKQRKGTGVLEYIGLVRLAAAKSLLEQGKGVGETALEVGYYSSRPLIRLFQEYEGLTPSQWAKHKKKS